LERPANYLRRYVYLSIYLCLSLTLYLSSFLSYIHIYSHNITLLSNVYIYETCITSSYYTHTNIVSPMNTNWRK